MDLSKYFPLIMILPLFNIKIGKLVIIINNNYYKVDNKKDQKHKKK